MARHRRNAAEQWTTMRLPLYLMEELRLHAAGLRTAYEQGQINDAPDDRWGYAAWRVVEIVLQRDQSHRQRGS